MCMTVVNGYIACESMGWRVITVSAPKGEGVLNVNEI